MHDPAPPSQNLLRIENLSVHFPIKKGLLRRTKDFIKAVDQANFVIPKGSTVGLVGESGSGKTTIGRSLIKLAPMTTGKIFYEEEEIGSLSMKDFFPYRKKIQMIFQDPYNSLNPRMSIDQTIREPLDIHFPSLSKLDKAKRIDSLLNQVGLSPTMKDRYPHEFSGGQRQRIGIARALAVEPDFIICDEPVSALDVSVQAQIVNLLQDLQEELGLTYLFIAHDLAVVEHISDTVLVMNHGKIVEQAEADDIYQNPQHEYTKRLLHAVPEL